VKKYRVEVTETLTHIVEIPADDEDSACQIVKEMYRNEDFILDYANFSSVDFTVT
jgi:hypothetical protein